MVKKFSLLFAVLLLLCTILLVSCAENDSGADVTSSWTEETSAPKNIELVVDGKAQYKIVCSDIVEKDSEILEAAVDISGKIKELTGVTPMLGTDFVKGDEKLDSQAREIIVGATKHEESRALLKNMDFNDYRICQTGNKLIVVSFSEEGYEKALEELFELFEAASSNGSLVLEGGIDISGSLNSYEMFDDVPMYNGGCPLEIFDTADENYMIPILDTDSEEYEEYCDELAENGFELYAENKIGDNLFSTYTKEDCILNCYYSVNDDAVRIIVEPNDSALPEKVGPYEKICEPQFSMVGLEFYGKGEDGIYNQIGLFMIWRLSDGRFVVVDGGGHYNAMGNKIASVLSSMAVDKNKITVAAWIFTHAHGDHAGGFLKFSDTDTAKKTTVENFIFNFGTGELYDNLEEGPERGRLDDVRKKLETKYADSNHIKAHSGQVFHFADIEIEMLYTLEDQYPNSFKTHNITSIVFRVNIGGKTFMALGDAYTTTSNLLVKRYGDELKSDIVQVTHHGFVGGTIPLYSKIDPDIVFWPGGDYRFTDLSQVSYNKHLLNNLSVKKVYVAGNRVYIFTLPSDYMSPDGTDK